MAYAFNPFTGTFDYFVAPAASNPPVPLSIAAGSNYTVAANTQTVFAVPIKVDGTLQIDGTLVD